MFSKVMFFLYPWRDALGITFAGVPFRLGEIWSCVFGVFLIKEKRIRLNKWERYLMFFLVFNLLITAAGVGMNYSSIEKSFAFKYIIRNIVNIVFIAGFLAGRMNVTPKMADRLFRYTVIVQVISYVFTIVTDKFFIVGQMVDVSSFDFTKVSIGGLTLYTMHGTSQEPGYLATLLPFTLYYFLQLLTDSHSDAKQRRIAKKYSIVILVLSALTFSSAVYVLVLVTCIAVMYKRAGNFRVNNYIILGLAAALVLCAALMLNDDARNYFQQNVLYKLKTYLFFNQQNYTNFSARTRGQHMRAAWDWFLTSSPLQFLIGHGTGGYWVYGRGLQNTLENEVSEAFNLYISTLTDRGILGFLCIAGILYSVYRMADKSDMVSKSLLWGIIVQAAHWMLTGNFWLYYFWFNIVFVMAYQRYKAGTDFGMVTNYG